MAAQTEGIGRGSARRLARRWVRALWSLYAGRENDGTIKRLTSRKDRSIFFKTVKTMDDSNKYELIAARRQPKRGGDLAEVEFVGQGPTGYST